MDDSIAAKLMQFLQQQRKGPLVPMSAGGLPMGMAEPPYMMTANMHKPQMPMPVMPPPQMGNRIARR